METIRITVECYDRKYSVETPSDIHISELTEELAKIAIMIGYLPISIYTSFEEYGAR